MKNTKIKIKCVGGGPIFSICYVWSLTQCHSWNSLPCNHQHTFSIATFYRPPATTISYDSTSSSPEKEITSSNRLGIPPRRGGGEKPEGPSALQPTTANLIIYIYVICNKYKRLIKSLTTNILLYICL